MRKLYDVRGESHKIMRGGGDVSALSSSLQRRYILSQTNVLDRIEAVRLTTLINTHKEKGILTHTKQGASFWYFKMLAISLCNHSVQNY
jgi:hypothetical protein